MAKKKVDITLSVKTQFENMAAEIEKYKKSLKDIKVSPLNTDLKNSYSSQIKEIEKLLKKINGFKLTTANSQEYTNLLNQLVGRYQELPQLFERVNKASKDYYSSSISKINEEIAAEKKKSEEKENAIKQLKEQFKEQNKLALAEKNQQLSEANANLANVQQKGSTNKTRIKELKQQNESIDQATKGYSEFLKLFKEDVDFSKLDFSKSFNQIKKYLKEVTTTEDEWTKARTEMAKLIGPEGAGLTNTSNLKELKSLFQIINGSADTKKNSNLKELEKITGEKYKAQIAALNKEIQELSNLLNTNTFNEAQTKKIQKAEEEFQKTSTKVNNLNEELKQLNDQTSKTNINNIGDSINTNISEIQVAVAKANEEINEALKLDAANNAANSIDNLVKQFFGFQMVVDIGRKALSSFKETMVDLDTNLTSIAAVTGRTREEMWDMVGTYNEMAQRLGTTTSQIAESAKLYYQQGRNDAEVTKLVEQTAVLATTAEIEYADATNYLTAAVNGFKMEAEDAVEITDAWSALAADAAVDVKELAESISKVASLAENSGMTLETTSAFLTQMINFATYTRVA